MDSSAKAVLAEGKQHSCKFCRKKISDEVGLGQMFQLRDYYVHYYCVLLSYGVDQKGLDEEGIYGFLYEDIEREVQRAKGVRCSYCNETGASVKCCFTTCQVQFHLPCGLDNKSMSQFSREFPSFCVKHRPRQAVPSQVASGAKAIPPVCPICLSEVDAKDRENSLWAPCCKKNWYHRFCVAKFALAAASLFKCSACSNIEKFRKAMIKFGIYVPERDAAWEYEPNYFRDLEYRHQQCDAPDCKCPKGRKESVDGSRWEIILCQSCGSQGTHVRCSNLNFHEVNWECSGCSEITTRSEAPENVREESSEESHQTSSSLKRKLKSRRRRPPAKKRKLENTPTKKTPSPKVQSSKSTPPSSRRLRSAEAGNSSKDSEFFSPPSSPSPTESSSDTDSPSSPSPHIQSSPSPVESVPSPSPSEPAPSPSPSEPAPSPKQAIPATPSREPLRVNSPKMDSIDVVQISDSEEEDVVKIEVVKRLCVTKISRQAKPPTPPEPIDGKIVKPLPASEQKNEFLYFHGKIYSCIECENGRFLLEPEANDDDEIKTVIKPRILRELDTEDKNKSVKQKKSSNIVTSSSQTPIRETSVEPVDSTSLMTPTATPSKENIVAPPLPSTIFSQPPFPLPQSSSDVFDIGGSNYEVVASHVLESRWVLPPASSNASIVPSSTQDVPAHSDDTYGPLPNLPLLHGAQAQSSMSPLIGSVQQRLGDSSDIYSNLPALTAAPHIQQSFISTTQSPLQFSQSLYDSRSDESPTAVYDSSTIPEDPLDTSAEDPLRAREDFNPCIQNFFSLDTFQGADANVSSVPSGNNIAPSTVNVSNQPVPESTVPPKPMAAVPPHNSQLIETVELSDDEETPVKKKKKKKKKSAKDPAPSQLQRYESSGEIFLD